MVIQIDGCGCGGGGGGYLVAEETNDVSAAVECK
jgi:hypothetical protein